MLLEIIVLTLAIPTGYLIAHLTEDELFHGRKWFRTIIILSAVLSVWFYLAKQVSVSLTLLFITIATLVSYKKSFDKGFIKKL